MGTEGYSPRLLQKIEYAGSNEPSFRVAGTALEQLAELSISDRHVERLTDAWAENGWGSGMQM